MYFWYIISFLSRMIWIPGFSSHLYLSIGFWWRSPFQSVDILYTHWRISVFDLFESRAHCYTWNSCHKNVFCRRFMYWMLYCCECLLQNKWCLHESSIKCLISLPEYYISCADTHQQIKVVGCKITAKYYLE